MIKVISLNQKAKPFYKIEQIKIKKAKYFNVKITQNNIKQFIKLTGDNSPIHSNKTFLKNNNFKKVLGHGFLITTILSHIYGKFFPGGLELCVKQICYFHKPFFVGDILKIKIIPLKKIKNLKLLEIFVEIKVKNTIIFTGDASFILSLKK